MKRDIKVMEEIMNERDKEIEREQQLPLDREGKELAEGKRFTFDVIDTPVDPLR